MMRIHNLTRHRLLAAHAAEARTFLARLRGWTRRRTPQDGEGLYLTPCGCVHSFGMGFALDAVYVDPGGRVLAVRTLAPGRIGPWLRRAAGVLELPAGTCARTGCAVGDLLVQEGGRGW
jgi:uncharacterized membrane protein (UPF0127 family)